MSDVVNFEFGGRFSFLKREFDAKAVNFSIIMRELDRHSSAEVTSRHCKRKVRREADFFRKMRLSAVFS